MPNKISLFVCLSAFILSACGRDVLTVTPIPATASPAETPSAATTESPPSTEIALPPEQPDYSESPGPHALGDMVFHQGLGMVIMMNGSEDNRLWGWDGVGWQVVGGEGPDGRTNSGLAYDPQRDKLVFYGGRSLSTEACVADTWEWSEQAWQELEVPGPDACSHFTMEYDPLLGKVLLFGGGDALLNIFTDMWTWDGRSWEQLDTQTPPARFHAMNAYDLADNILYLLGGFDIDNQMKDEMWAWEGAAWEVREMARPPARSHARMAFDINRQELVLFGGSAVARAPFELNNETWIYSADNWRQMDPAGPIPSPRGGHMMAYDPVRGRVVLFGGFDQSEQLLADTWEWDGSGWNCMDGCASGAGAPPPVLYQNDPQRTGAYDFAAVRNPVSALWQVDVGRTSLGSPLYADGILYVGTQNDRLLALDAETGEELWAFRGFGNHVSPIAIDGEMLFAAGLNGTLFAFNLADQSQVWSFNADGAVWFAPLVVGETVYIVSERGAYALEKQTGEIIWQLQTGDHRGFVGSPAMDGDTLFFEVGPKIFAVQAATGEIVWQKEMPTWNYALALAEGLIFSGSDDGHFYALDQQSGEEVWNFEGDGAGWSAPAIAGGIVYVGNVDQHVYALDASTGQEIWRFETADWAVSDPVISDGVVYVGVGNHENREGPRPLYAIDAATGQELWQFQANSRLMTAVALGPERIFAVTIEGTVYALGEAAVQSAEPLEAGQWSVMVYHEGLEQVLLVNGGPEFGKPAGEPLELWGWDGQAWTLVDNSGPAWRNWAGVAYDAGRDVLVIHGGNRQNTWFDETWEWDGRDWTLYDGAGPGGREGAGFIYDSVRGKVVLFGGAVAGPNIVGDTWEWDGQNWEQVSESGPPARFPGGVGYDPNQGQMLIYGGHDVRTNEDIPFFSDSWVWDGLTWREIPLTGANPGIRVATSFVFDPLNEQILMFGGAGVENFFSDLWAWDGMGWELVAEDTGMPLRSGFNIVVYDPTRDIFVLFGGVDRPGGQVVDETWEWDRESWTCVAGCED